ncbi:MAG: hypothetical protein FJ027_21330 [Candidatus Rokubacteria bacterium]|nr:hypothetical protein [Candidatus Rokubacteria bacterium]
MRAFPRVTEILASVGLGPDFEGVPVAVLENARRRGSEVHAAIEAIVYGYLDESSLADDVVPRVDAYRRFIKESGFETEATEREVVSATWRYRGHPDTVGWLQQKRLRVILDWKNTDHCQLGPAGWQLAAYRAAWNEQHPHAPVAALGVVQLRGDGTYSFHEVSVAAAEPVWFAAVTVYHARQDERRQDEHQGLALL